MRQIIVGFADTPTAHEAVRVATQLAEQLGAALHVVMATEDDSSATVRIGSDVFTVSDVETGKTSIRDFMSALPASSEYTMAVGAGSPADVLVSEAVRLNADLIVVGNVRMQGIGRVLGSVGGAVIHQAPCSVLIVKTT